MGKYYFIFLFILFSCKSPEVVAPQANSNTNSVPTLNVILPVIKLLATNPADIKLNSIVLNGEVSDEGGSSVTERGFYWSEINSSPNEKDNKIQVGSGKGTFLYTLEGLKNDTKYYFRSYSTNSKGTSFSDVQTFKTKSISFLVNWDKTFGSNDSEYLKSALVTKDKNLLLLGDFNAKKFTKFLEQTILSGFSTESYLLNLNGSTIWYKNYWPSDEFLKDAIITEDGGYILLGQQGGTSIRKYDSKGIEIWKKQIPQIVCRKIIKANDGGYLIIGDSDGPINSFKSETGKGEVDVWVLKVDENGNKIWDKTFGGNKTDNGIAIKSTTNGYVIIASSNSEISSDKSEASRGMSTIGKVDFWCIKIDNKGNKIWDKTLGGDGEDIGVDIELDDEDNIYLGGVSGSNKSGDKSENNHKISSPDGDYWIIKLDTKGNKIWDKTIGGTDVEYLSQISFNKDLGIMLFGSTGSGNSGDVTGRVGTIDYWVISLDKNGNKLWNKLVGGKSDDILVKVVEGASPNELIFCGFSNSDKSGDKSDYAKIPPFYDYWILSMTLKISD